MRRICDALAETDLFRGLNHDLYLPFCAKTQIQLYWKGDIIAHEGEVCNGLTVIFEGQVLVQRNSANGEDSAIALLNNGHSYGEHLMFGTLRHYTANLEALGACKLVVLPREDILRLIGRSPQLMNRFLISLSNEVERSNRRIYLLSQRSLRQKVSAYLLYLLECQLMDSGQTLYEASRIISTQAVELPVSKELVARLLAMPRPSLSRELISMEEDGLIRVSGRVIWLVDIKRLEDGLQN